MKYGYIRISTRQQNIERQRRNIIGAYPDAVIIEEVFTGTSMNRAEFQKLLAKVKSGDTIIFDSVSRMSRTASEGVETYMELYSKGIELVFLKEPYINTATYKEAVNKNLELTGNEIADCYIRATNEVMKILAEQQIRIAFEQSEKEVQDLRQRTSEGIRTAKLNGKQIGAVEGVKLTTKKSIEAKEIIRTHAKAFGGSLSDAEVQKLCGISRNSYYKYKREIKSE